MATIRQEKIARLLLKELGIIFQRESKTWFDGAFITVTIVRPTPDLSIAKVYLSIWGVPDKEKALENVKDHHGHIRRQLGNNVRHQLRIVPEFQFYIDDSLDYAENIEKLLKQ